MRARLIVVPFTLLALAGWPAGAGVAVIGLSDQDPSAWGDARLCALSVGYARLVVPWNGRRPSPRACRRG
jgi:hypothetical protein